MSQMGGYDAHHEFWREGAVVGDALQEVLPGGSEGRLGCGSALEVAIRCGDDVAVFEFRTHQELVRLQAKQAKGRQELSGERHMLRTVVVVIEVRPSLPFVEARHTDHCAP